MVHRAAVRIRAQEYPTITCIQTYKKWIFIQVSWAFPTILCFFFLLKKALMKDMYLDRFISKLKVQMKSLEACYVVI